MNCCIDQVILLNLLSEMTQGKNRKNILTQNSVLKYKVSFRYLQSRLSKILIRFQSLSMGPLLGYRAFLGGLEFGFREILANGAGQKKIRNWNVTSCSEFQTDYDALFTISIL